MFSIINDWDQNHNHKLYVKSKPRAIQHNVHFYDVDDLGFVTFQNHSILAPSGSKRETQQSDNSQGLLFSVLKLRLRLKQLDLLIAATLGGSGGGSSTLRLQKDFDFVKVDPLRTEMRRASVNNVI